MSAADTAGGLGLPENEGGTGVPGEETGAAAGPDVGMMVSRLLAHPELLNAVASAVGVSSAPLPEANAEREGKREEAPREQKTSGRPDAPGALSAVLSMLGGGGCGKEAARRNALLAALRPYCGEHRRHTIDTMISLSKLSGSLKGGG